MDVKFEFKYVLDLLKDASVAIVGNAPMILNQHHGDEIDSHDVVIRMNLGYPDTNYDALGRKTTIASTWTPICDPDRFPGKKWFFVLNDTPDHPDYKIPSDKVTAVLRNSELKIERLNTINNASSGCIWSIISIFANAKVIDCYGRDKSTSHNFYDVGQDKSSWFHHNFANEEDLIIDYANKSSVKLNMILD